MKRGCIAVAALIGLSAFAQNWSVTYWKDYYPTNEYYRMGGAPTNWPAVSYPIGTNVTTTNPAVVLSGAQLSSLISSNQSQWNFAKSNAAVVYASNLASNYTAWSNMYVQIPQGITDSSNRFNTFTNMSSVMTSLRSSWQSGTNTATGTNVIISRLFTNMVLWAQQDQVGWTYLNQVIVYLSRLGPGLQQVYKPESDPVGH